MFYYYYYYYLLCQFVLILLPLLFLNIGFVTSEALYNVEKYRFFQLKHKLFAINLDSLKIWHVDRSEHKTSYNNNNNNHSIDASKSAIIQLNFVNPFELDNFKLLTAKVNLTQVNIKFVFIARLAERCSILVLMNSKLEYRGWRIRINQSYFEPGVQGDNDSRPFLLSNLGKNMACASSIPASGNMKSLNVLNGLLTVNQSVISVWSTDNHTKLYFMGTDRYIKLHLDQLTIASDLPDQAIKVVLINNTDHLTSSVSMIYKNKYLIRIKPNQSDVCIVKSLQDPLQFGKKCTALYFFFESSKLALSLYRNMNLLGNNLDYEEATTSHKVRCSLTLLKHLNIFLFSLKF